MKPAHRDNGDAGAAMIALLTKVVDQLRPLLARDIPVRERIVDCWSVIVESRDLGASDVVEDDFRRAAAETGLIADLGRHGHEDFEHVLRAGMRGWNPFEKGRAA
jgi:hypothetical protein